MWLAPVTVIQRFQSLFTCGQNVSHDLSSPPAFGWCLGVPSIMKGLSSGLAGLPGW